MNLPSSIPSTQPPTASLGDWLTEILKQRLLSGGYKPGQWLRESALQNEFGISNGPVREAMQNLIVSGILVRRAHRGVQVVALTKNELIELFEVRLALLEIASERLAGFARTEDLATGQAIIDKVIVAARKKDVDALVLLGGELVDWICQSTGNQHLINTWEQLTFKARIYIYASLKANRDIETVSLLWQKLFSQISAGDTKAARNAARAMVRETLRDLDLEVWF
jgi:DNA-binding GntR family transcriptional regulator